MFHYIVPLIVYLVFSVDFISGKLIIGKFFTKNLNNRTSIATKPIVTEISPKEGKYDWDI